MKASGQNSEIRLKCCVLIYQRPGKWTNRVCILSKCPTAQRSKVSLMKESNWYLITSASPSKHCQFSGLFTGFIGSEIWWADVLSFLCLCHLPLFFSLLQLAGCGNKDNKCSVKAVEEMLESMQITMSWCPHLTTDPSAQACPCAAAWQFS